MFIIKGESSMSFRKTVLTAFSIILTAGLLSGCGSTTKNASKQSALERIKAAGQIKIATEGTSTPFSYHDKDGNLTGFDIEIGKAVAKKLGVTPVFIETKWDSIVAGLDAGRFDTVTNQMAITEERKKKFDFSKPYIYIHEVLVTRKDNHTLTSFKNLKGQKVSQVLGSNLGRTAEKYGGVLVGVDDFVQSIDLVLAGRTAGTVTMDIVLADYLKQKPETPLKIVDTAENTITCGIPVKKGNEDLMQAIDQALDELRKDGTLTKISMKYYGKDVTVEK